MIKRIWIGLILIGLFLSCADKGKPMAGEGNTADITIEEIEFPPSEVLNEKAYPICSSCTADGASWIVGYNPHIHALDFINLNTKEMRQVKLEMEGDASVLRPLALYAYRLDSIWLYDEAGQLTLMNREGKIVRKDRLTGHPEEEVMIRTNHAMYTSRLHYIGPEQSVYFIIRKGYLYFVKKYSLENQSATYYKLAPPYTTKRNVSSDFGNMDGVNATFTDSLILYNYPIESVFYVLDKQTGESRLIESYTTHGRNTAKPLDAASDYSQWERHGLENPHFFEVAYIPQKKMYMRLHLKETVFNPETPVVELSDNRELYLTCWDESFRLLCETRLPMHRYNYYTGWCALSDGLLLFVHNSTSKDETDDTLRTDIVKLD